ncbi:hypothetical protein CAEBREN_02665 [Caenorhabditis brenneri]|uniref:F-box domain-containing protein n=1 Tax=Caenorhabditis brenneri TaxID=135651 RepID=G0MVR6_CAEBE|nr:hypothetical protein CAEBREN_02665 [Caenorhabditis brenneri]
MQKTQTTLDFLKANPTYLRICVQYETLDKDIPILYSYRNFCLRLGDDVMDYPEFEFWYWRFYHGETDLEVDRSSVQPKTTFSDLPVKIIGKFVDEMDPVDRILFRQASPQLQSIVDGQRLELPGFGEQTFFTWDASSATIRDESFGTIQFNKSENRFYINQWRDTIDVKASEYLDTVLNGFLTIFGAPGAKFDELHVEYDADSSKSCENWKIMMENLKKFLESSNRKLQIQKLVFNASDAPKPAPTLLLPLLPLIKGLENLHILSRHREVSYSKLAKLEEWKQAKTIKLISVDGLGAYCSHKEIKYFSHFEQFDVTVDGLSVGNFVEHVKKLTESKTFKKCTISGAFTFTALDYATASNKVLQENKTVREPIENSEEYLELKFFIDYSDGSVVIERKKEKMSVVKKKKMKKRSVSAAGENKKRSVSAAGKAPWRN